MTQRTRTAVVTASVAAVLGVLLIWAPGSLAYLKASKTGTPLTITSGSLSATVSAPTVSSPSIGTASNGVVVNAGSVGIVPGIQAERLTYQLTNNGTARSPASASVKIASASVTDQATWDALRPFLTITVSINGGTATTVPAAAITSTGVSSAVLASSAAIQPGTSIPVTVTFSIPGTSGGLDLARSLLQYRSAALTVSSVIQIAPVFTLTQVPVTAS